MAGEHGTETDERDVQRPGLSRGAQLVLGLVVLVLLGWFVYAWRVRGIRMADAAGESIGTALVLLILVSIAGAIRRGRRP